MARDPRDFLSDALKSARSIPVFTKDLDEGAYAGNELVQAAVERKFEVIGEFLTQLARVHSTLASRIPDLAQTLRFVIN